MTLETFLDDFESRSRSLVVINRSAPEQIQTMLEEAFVGQEVTVGERSLPEEDDDVVVLVEETDEGAELIATSPLETLESTILLVNSDLYRTGARKLGNFELPDVLARLDDVQFRLQGYPESNYEKLLLIVISRYIERHAWEANTGTLRTSFQRLSRIEDERGTKAVYEKLADSDTQTHVYGIPDWTPDPEFEVVAHGGYTDDFRDSWFVVYTPPDGETVEGRNGESHVALLAIETSPRVWEAFWTFRPSRVERIEGYITRNL
jgi:hypothetical protein